jgi:putative tryptophan/tyrosine transport system substrate-binding protein
MQFDQLKRREFITLLGGAAAWTVVDTALSQPGAKASRVGLLTTSDAAGRRAALVPALEALGYREGQNLVLEVRSADGRLDQLPPLAEELIRAGVEVIVAVNSPGTQAAIASGTKIPIVMALVGDPVGTGFVPNLNRPGGTVTGVSNASGHTAAKRLELLKNAIPAARRIAVFTHAGDPVSAVQVRDAEAAAGQLGVELKVFPVVESREAIEGAVAAAIDWRAQAVFRVLAQVAPGLSKFQAELLLKHRMPAMLANQFDVQNGGLMCYFADLSEHWRHVADYVDRILKGAAPGDLPIMLPTKFQLVLNLKTARALGLELPPSILALADEVIE